MRPPRFADPGAALCAILAGLLALAVALWWLLLGT